MSNQQVRDLALATAVNAVDEIEFSDIRDIAALRGYKLTESELSMAYRMAIRANVELQPRDM